MWLMMVNDGQWWLMMFNDGYISGWWYTYPSDKYEFVSWDYETPNIWKNNPNVPNHQPDIYIYTLYDLMSIYPLYLFY